MIELYGNKIWNSNTPNKYKKVIIASEDSLDNICQELENSGLNYCAYIFNGEAHIAIGRATATNIDKLDIDYQTVIECNSKVYKTNNIIGTTTYDSIEDKLYRKYNTDFAYKIGQRLTEQGILFSGRIYGKTTTITVDKQYADTLNKISAELKEQRASFMSKSEVVQNESPEESKSVNEKISELHFNESQLSALAPSVKFIQTRNDDNLTDNFVSWFSDCTDFYESQLSALAEIYVDTYQSFSDKSLMFADTSRINDLKQRFVNDNITAKLTENRGYSTTQLEIIREMVTYGMSESVINLLDYTFSIDEMQNFFTAYKNGSYEDLINLIADIKGTTRTDIEGQIEGGTYTPEIPDYDFLSKNLIFHNPSANHFTVMYFNPDSETGGQFVSTDINYNVAWRGNRDFTNDSERFWRYVEITGNQTLSDVGSKFFRESLNYFYSGEQIAEGLTTDTQKLIADVATAEMIKSGELIEPESFDVAKFDTLISEQKEITSNNSDKNTIVINAFAGPGAGKTTSCLEVAEKLKKQGFVTEYVQEYAKELVYDNNLIMLDGHYEHQFAILNEQMKRINRLYGKVDFIVTDSPILLNNTYLNEDKNTEVYSAYSDSVNKLYGLYNNFNYFVERDTSVFEKEGRIHNLEQSIAIDNELKNMLHNNQIDFDVYTHATIDNIVRDSTIIYAKQLINSYCQDEFDSEADFSDLKKVGVAYTTTEDSKHTVEAVVNLVDYRLETYVDDKLFKEETYADLKDMIDNCLHSLSFDDLVYLSDEELAPFYEEHDELDDVDPAVIRQQLEDAGIVNGELVDEDKLNSLINPSFEDDPGTKLNVCVNNVFDIYEKTSDKKLTQIVFCDLGVPSKNSSADGNKDDDTKSVAELDSLEESGKFCVYDDIRDKLIAKGVSADEIAYIHNAKSETQKSELFAKVRSGEVRILLGSTGKMGTGTNVQDRIIALHDLDVPWRPSDLEQRRGRMVRQGNINDKVHLYRYVTKGTFDAYSYQLLEKKQKFISQIMTSKEPGRKCADVDQAALTYSEIKALCTGDERIREKLTLENRVKELQALKSEYNSTRYELEDKVNAYPEERKKLLLDIGNISKDMETVKNIPFDVKTESYQVKITIGKDAYSLLDDESRKVAAKALTNAVAQVKGDANKNKRIAIGGLGNFGVDVINDGYFLDKITATLRGNYTYSVELGVSSIINLKKIENLLFKVENVLNDKKSELNKLDIDYKTAQNMLNKPFEFEDELNSSTKRLDELTTALNIEMSEQHKSADKPKKTHYFGKDFILGKKKSSKQIQNNEVMKSEPKRSEPEL